MKMDSNGQIVITINPQFQPHCQGATLANGGHRMRETIVAEPSFSRPIREGRLAECGTCNYFSLPDDVTPE